MTRVRWCDVPEGATVRDEDGDRIRRTSAKRGLFLTYAGRPLVPPVALDWGEDDVEVTCVDEEIDALP